MKRSSVRYRWTLLLFALACAACSSTGERDAPPTQELAAAPAKPPAPSVTPKPKPAPAAPESVAAPKEAARSKGADDLAKARRSYEDGDYKAAATQLASAIELGLARGEQAIARKHLAFIYCATNRRTLCRVEFRKAFEADPAFDLAPAEAGHPLWGPVFRSVKREVAAKAKLKPKP